MKNQKVIYLIFTCFLFLILMVSACKEDKTKCLKCNAVCESEPAAGGLDYCGENLDAQEAAFRAEHEGCTISCTRE